MATPPNVQPPLFISRYEIARALSLRAVQLSRNAPPHVTVDPGMEPLEIARRELMERRLPMTIVRQGKRIPMNEFQLLRDL